MTGLRTFLIVSAMVAASGAAHAQTAAPAAPTPPPVLVVRAPLNLDRGGVSPIPVQPADPLRDAAAPARSVEGKFTSAGNLVGSLGFLCGREPGHGESGSAAAFGYDPHGRFLGAKVSYGF